MSQSRRVARLVTVPPLTPGFAGPGHLATHVVSPEEFERNDPFILLADDHLDIGDRPVGGPHPHAGFETVTLVLDGALYDRDEGGIVSAGEVQWMTAGRGIIHGEHVSTRGRARVLQLWVTLPKDRRSTEPAFQNIHADAVPIRREPGVELRVYSGVSGGHRSATRNHVPVTIVEGRMAPHARVDQAIPASYNGFAYVVAGSVRIGDDGTLVSTGQVAWFDRPEGDDTSVVHVAAGEEGARFVLYAGEPQHDPLVVHGPFVADSRQEIARLYARFQNGEFERMSRLVRAAAGRG